MPLINIGRNDTQTTPHGCQSCKHFRRCRFLEPGAPRRDCITSPATAYALILMDQCDNDLDTACALARIQINHSGKAKHWIEVYSVLVGEHGHA